MICLLHQNRRVLVYLRRHTFFIIFTWTQDEIRTFKVTKEPTFPVLDWYTRSSIGLWFSSEFSSKTYIDTLLLHHFIDSRSITLEMLQIYIKPKRKSHNRTLMCFWVSCPNEWIHHPNFSSSTKNSPRFEVLLPWIDLQWRTWGSSSLPTSSPFQNLNIFLPLSFFSLSCHVHTLQTPQLGTGLSDLFFPQLSRACFPSPTTGVSVFLAYNKIL